MTTIPTATESSRSTTLLARRLSEALEGHATRLQHEAHEARLLAEGLESGRFTIDEGQITYAYLDIDGEDGYVGQVQGGVDEACELPFDLIRSVKLNHLADLDG